MSGNQSRFRDRRLWGALFIALGLFVVAASIDIIKADESTFHAPRWVVFLAGVVAVLAGSLLFVAHGSRARDLLTAGLLLSMGAVATWVSIFSSAEGFSGGISLLPREANVVVARVLSGFGAILSFGLAAYTVRRAVRHDA
ncbi:MAG: hypothetical protein ACE5M4_09070 [Anaerolineales bacterium]